jgi:hypothetical protein
MLADIPAAAYTTSWSDFFNAEFTANFKIDFSHLPDGLGANAIL